MRYALRNRCTAPHHTRQSKPLVITIVVLHQPGLQVHSSRRHPPLHQYFPSLPCPPVDWTYSPNFLRHHHHPRSPMVLLVFGPSCHHSPVPSLLAFRALLGHARRTSPPSRPIAVIEAKCRASTGPRVPTASRAKQWILFLCCLMELPRPRSQGASPCRTLR